MRHQALEQPQTGWSFGTDHPVRASQDAFGDIFMIGTATPPVPGGEYAFLKTEHPN